MLIQVHTSLVNIAQTHTHIALICIDTDTYLICEHSTEVITAGSEYNSMSWKLLALNIECNITQCIGFPKIVHGAQYGFRVAVSKNLTVTHLVSPGFDIVLRS